MVIAGNVAVAVALALELPVAVAATNAPPSRRNKPYPGSTTARIFVQQRPGMP